MLLEYPDFSALEEGGIVAIHPEMHDRWMKLADWFLHHQGDWIRRNSEPPPRFEIVHVELDIGVVERDVGAALDVGRAAVQVIDRLAVDGDVHHIQLVRALRAKLLG